MNLNELYELFLHHEKITTDSRHCPANSLFFALKGERFDGNQYAAKALEAGAAYTIDAFSARAEAAYLELWGRGRAKGSDIA